MARVIIDIFEKQPQGERRVIRHEFFGKDKAEAEHYVRSHRKSDKFLDAALSGRPFKGIQLEVSKPKTAAEKLIADRDKRKK